MPKFVFSYNARAGSPPQDGFPGLFRSQQNPGSYQHWKPLRRFEGLLPESIRNRWHVNECYQGQGLNQDSADK